MARIRTIKPSFFKSLSVTTLPKATRLTWVGLWTYVDDDGRGVDDSRLIKAELWPLDDDYTAKKVESDMVLLEDNGSIQRYVVDGRRYFMVVKWRSHQRIDKPTRSILPPPPAPRSGAFPDQSIPQQTPLPEDSGRTPRKVQEASVQEGNREEGRGKGGTAKPSGGKLATPKRFDPEARELVDEWWESQDPRPPNKYWAVVTVVQQMLASGVDRGALRRALDEAPTPSVPALQVALSRQNGSTSHTGRILTETDGPTVSYIPEDWQ